MISFPWGPSVESTTLLFSSISLRLRDLHLTYTWMFDSEMASLLLLLQMGGGTGCFPFEGVGDGACAIVFLLFASKSMERRLGKEERAMTVWMAQHIRRVRKIRTVSVCLYVYMFISFLESGACVCAGHNNAKENKN